MPEKGSREANNLASLASKARWGKADARYERAFSKFWYHKNDDKKTPEMELASDEAREDTDDTTGD